MSVIFKAISSDKKLVILNKSDLEKYLLEHNEKELVVEIKEFDKSGEKTRLLAYYHSVVLNSAVQGFRDSGDICDTVTADYKLRCEFAKIFIKDSAGNHVAVLEEKSKMLKKRLVQYVNDCIMWIESTFNLKIPDSESYLAEKKHGKKFETVKSHIKKSNFEQI